MTGRRVLLAYVHSGETVAYSWHESMMGLAFHFVQSEHFGAKLPIRYGTGGLVQARNKAVDILLEQNELDWLFWIDTDMGFEPSIVDDLMVHADPLERPVVGALCFINHEVHDDGYNGSATMPKPTIFNWAKNPDGTTGFVPNMHYQRDALVKCDATGSAAVVIHRSVFEKIRDRNGGNYYGHIALPDEDVPLSEDLSFCVRCVEEDVPIHIATGVKTTHYKPRWLSERDLDMAMLAHEAEQAKGSSGVVPINHRPNREQRRAEAKRRA